MRVSGKSVSGCCMLDCDELDVHTYVFCAGCQLSGKSVSECSTGCMYVFCAGCSASGEIPVCIWLASLYISCASSFTCHLKFTCVF